MNGRVAGPPVWTSSFRIAHRVSGRVAAGRVFFAGAAAHVHSPIGARGMNLGLEDAWVFARLIKRGHLHRYQALRWQVDRSVVRRIELLSRIVSAQPRPAGLLRRLLPSFFRNTRLRQQMVALLTGTDHELRPRLELAAAAPTVA